VSLYLKIEEMEKDINEGDLNSTLSHNLHLILIRGILKKK